MILSARSIARGELTKEDLLKANEDKRSLRDLIQQAALYFGADSKQVARICNRLKWYKIETKEQLLTVTDDDVLRMRNLGDLSRNIIRLARCIITGEAFYEDPPVKKPRTVEVKMVTKEVLDDILLHPENYKILKKLSV